MSVLGLATGILARATGGIWLKVAVGILVAAAVTAASVHYLGLRADSAQLAALIPRISGLESSLGCPDRPKQERDLFNCIPARDRDAAQARAEAIRKNEAAAAIARASLERQAAELQSELDAANDAIEAAAAADDGPVPKVMRDNWRRERARRGVK